jgi:hypothetical protein
MYEHITKQNHMHDNISSAVVVDVDVNQKLAQMVMNIDRVFDKVLDDYQTTNIQKSVYVYSMAEARTTIAESGYQEIFTAFFAGASKVEAHYYSLKELHKDVPNLTRLLGVLYACSTLNLGFPNW